MGKMIAIGGVTPPRNLDLIDSEIIRLTGKASPRVLYVPTAGGDNLNYCNFYRGIYEGRFGCEFQELFLVNETPSEDEIRAKVFSSDIVYVGGGSSSKLMDYFRRFKLDIILEEAFHKGIVLAGISAGALIWGNHYFDTDNTAGFKNEGFADYRKVDCLEFLDFIICPHYNLEGYSEKMEVMVKEFKSTGIALDNDCALEVIDNSYRIISTIDSANAYKICLKEGSLSRDVITKTLEYKSIKEI